MSHTNTIQDTYDCEHCNTIKERTVTTCPCQATFTCQDCGEENQWDIENA